MTIARVARNGIMGISLALITVMLDRVMPDGELMMMFAGAAVSLGLIYFGSILS